MTAEAGTDQTENAGRWSPSTPVGWLPGVGPKTAARLEAQGLRTVLDLVMRFPRRYRELTELTRPGDSAIGSHVRLHGRVMQVRVVWLGRRRCLVTVDFASADSSPFQALFFNNPWLAKSLAPGDRRAVEGILERRGRRFVVKGARLLAAGDVTPGPVQLRYAELEGVSETRLRRWLDLCLQRLDWDAVRLPPLPPGLAEWDASPRELMLAMHRPESLARHERARRHFALREAVELFAGVERARRARRRRHGPAIAIDEHLHGRIEARIPFAWTTDQAAAVAVLRKELAGPAPMGVLLQGDVGTGKTAVAVYATLATIAAGFQVAFLAPTELLAEQHREAVGQWLAGSRVRVDLLCAGRKTDEQELARRRLAAGELDLVFGTHALISEQTRFARLGLIVIDEQHRFGVGQRMQLVGKAPDAHVLVMTATPIPRTLALALFGDLDLITLRERPPGRRPVPAVHVPPKTWGRVKRLLARRVRRGGRAFVVCPLVGEGGEAGGAVRVHEDLAREFRCGLVHGRMSAADRQQVTTRFRDGDLDVLVGTTVLEVGVDVPEATVMVVVAAERFGLATLHQLRGRVGRGGRRGICVLTGSATARTAAVCRTTDGFALAEEDLRLRGSGELLGTAQSGFGELRALDPVEDLELLQKARLAVREA